MRMNGPDAYTNVCDTSCRCITPNTCRCYGARRHIPLCWIHRYTDRNDDGFAACVAPDARSCARAIRSHRDDAGHRHMRSGRLDTRHPRNPS
ncbi:hypothetical protein OH687_35825 [Burkholderia anthina]|nr:hypothetical protein OH687_35825 [Burkholderia anthina]